MKQTEFEKMFTTENVKLGLDFYNIQDNDYEQTCISAIESIKSNEKLLNKVFEVYNIIYGNDERITDLWELHDVREVFGDNMVPFITNILVLLGAKQHQNTFINYKFDNKQIDIHKKRVKECLTNDIYNRKYESIRISQMLWGSYFITGKLIEVGRLQYACYGDCIKIHIPPGSKLDFDEVKKSIQNSKGEIKKYYNKENVDYCCKSWLLSKQIKQMVNEESNISKFQSLFTIEEGDSCIKNILNFVYSTTQIEDYNLLPENTSLQKQIKEYLIKGNDIKEGKGKLIIM